VRASACSGSSSTTARSWQPHAAKGASKRAAGRHPCRMDRASCALRSARNRCAWRRSGLLERECRRSRPDNPIPRNIPRRESSRILILFSYSRHNGTFALKMPCFSGFPPEELIGLWGAVGARVAGFTCFWADRELGSICIFGTNRPRPVPRAHPPVARS
jgi:hypothetical protein